MDPITMYVLFLLVNGVGVKAEGFKDMESCTEGWIEAVHSADVIMASDCAPMTLKPLKHEIQQGGK